VQSGCSFTELLASDDPDVQAADAAYKRREARKKTCVLCFSTDCSNPLMWTFYAQEHLGFCLGFGTEGELLRRARPVLYTHSPADVLHLQDPVTGNDPLSFCKSIDWQFEHEWRVCLQELGPKRVDMSKERLVSVHVGYRMQESQLQELIATLYDAGYKPDDTKLFRVERIHMSFLLFQKPINW